MTEQEIKPLVVEFNNGNGYPNTMNPIRLDRTGTPYLKEAIFEGVGLCCLDRFGNHIILIEESNL